MDKDKSFGIAAIIVVGLFVGSLIALSRLPDQPTKSTVAVVTGIYPTGNKIPGDVVVIKTADGAIGSGGMPVWQLGCHLGDTVRAMRTGITVHLAPGSCNKLAPPKDRIVF